jgi:hypothetical protein
MLRLPRCVRNRTTLRDSLVLSSDTVDVGECRMAGRLMGRLADDYLEQARECREAALRATSPEVKHRFCQMAETWELLARQRLAYTHIADVLAKVKGDNDNGGSDAA